MNIDNALYALNIAPDARQLTVFIDGEAIPQSRPKIATRGKNGVPLPHAIAYYKDASIYYRQQCEYCIKQAVQKSGIFFKDVALFCEVSISYSRYLRKCSCVSLSSGSISSRYGPICSMIDVLSIPCPSVYNLI